jgi:glutamyl-tRNA synthetase
MVDEFIEFGTSLGTGLESSPRVHAALCRLSAHVQMRTFLVGHAVTLADVAMFAALGRTEGWAEREKTLKDTFPHVARWWRQCRSLQAFTKSVAMAIRVLEKAGAPAAGAAAAGGAASKGGAAASAASAGASAAAATPKGGLVGVLGAEGDVDHGAHIEVPFAEMGKVCTRFPPEPSGYLHIGHCKAALLNNYVARKYQGTLIIRFDDTNPSNESAEFVNSILEDLALLKVKGDKLTYTSDSFPICEKYCEQLIREGKAYADDTPVEQMRHERGEGIESKCRTLPVEESLRRWAEMLKGSEEGLKNCIRARMDMKDPNKCMRDAVLYRCNLTPHHRTGTKYKAYPSYDFACPIVDSIEGVTHAMRTNEYSARIPQYKWMLRALNLRDVNLFEFSRLNLYKCVLSKRKLQWFVDSGKVEGWHDPRFPTVRGIMRRGLCVEALAQFALEQGNSPNTNLMDWDKIWAINKKIIDPKVPRYTAISTEHHVKVTLSGGPSKVEFLTRPAHPKNKEVGDKVVAVGPELWVEQADAASLAVGEEFTLMEWGNAIAREITKDPATGLVTGIRADLHLAGDFKTTEKKITWICDQPDLVPCDFIEFDYLITKNKIEPEEDIKDFLTEKTKYVTPALGDQNIRSLAKGAIFQVPRRGFYIVDEPYLPPMGASTKERPAQLFFVPDGKVGAISILGNKVALRDGATESAKSIARKEKK